MGQKKIEMIIEYTTDGTDYQYNDNHGILTRCKDCKHWKEGQTIYKDEPTHSFLKCANVCDRHYRESPFITPSDGFCYLGDRRVEE